MVAVTHLGEKPKPVSRFLQRKLPLGLSTAAVISPVLQTGVPTSRGRSAGGGTGPLSPAFAGC